MGFQQEDQQSEKIEHFIEAINKDINSGLHALEGNRLLKRTIAILNLLDKYSPLSLLQVIRGCLNMMVRQIDPYDYLEPSFNPDPSAEIAERCHRFIKDRETWCDIKNEGLDRGSEEEFALILSRAAKGPLYLSARCMPNTMALYFKSLKELDGHFIPPQVPEPKGNYTVKSPNYYFDEMTYQPPFLTQEEKWVTRIDDIHILQEFMSRLSTKSYLERINQVDALCRGDNDGDINTVLRKLSDDLSTAIKTYIKQIENSSNDVWVSSQKRLLRDISSTLIQQAKSSLKDNWKDWLSDLFTQLINQFKHFLYRCNPTATRAEFIPDKRPKRVEREWLEDCEQKLISQLMLP